MNKVFLKTEEDIVKGSRVQYFNFHLSRNKIGLFCLKTVIFITLLTA